MKNAIIFSMCALVLSACGSGSDEPSVYHPPTPIYSTDTFSGEYDLTSLFVFSAVYFNYKTYHFDSNNNFFVEYSDRPIFKTEILQHYITEEGISTIMPPQLEHFQYLVGEKANFDGENLQYTVSNYVTSRPLALSWKYKKIDVSSKAIESDQNNPMHAIKKSPNAEIMAAILGIGYPESNKLFPQGSICWQKQSAQTNQEYIEFYPEKIIRHVGEDSEIDKSGQWSKVSWVQYKKDNNEPERANLKLSINDKIYWGFYHPLNEIFTIEPNQLTCDYMNETAFKAAMFRPDAITELRRLEVWDKWPEFYLKD